MKRYLSLRRNRLAVGLALLAVLVTAATMGAGAIPGLNLPPISSWPLMPGGSPAASPVRVAPGPGSVDTLLSGLDELVADLNALADEIAGTELPLIGVELAAMTADFKTGIAPFSTIVAGNTGELLDALNAISGVTATLDAGIYTVDFTRTHQQMVAFLPEFGFEDDVKDQAISLSTSATLDLEATFSAFFKFGTSSDEFFVDTATDDISIELTLDGIFDANGTLGFVDISSTGNSATLAGTFTLDLIDDGDGKTTLTEILALGPLDSATSTLAGAATTTLAGIDVTDGGSPATVYLPLGATAVLSWLDINEPGSIVADTSDLEAKKFFNFNNIDATTIQAAISLLAGWFIDSGDHGALGENLPLTQSAFSDLVPIGVELDESAVDLQVVEIEISTDGATVSQGGELQFTASGTLNDASINDLSAEVIWSSSNKLVATVDADGTVTGVGPGTVDIIARLRGIESNTVSVEVGP